MAQITRLTIFILISFFYHSVMAEANNKVAQKNPNPNLIDSTHSMVTNRLFWLANRVDSFFGDKRADDETNTSTIRIFTDYSKRDSMEAQKEVNLRFNLKLPSTEKKVLTGLKKGVEMAVPGVGPNESDQQNNQSHQARRSSDNKREEWEELSKEWIFSTDLNIRLKAPTQLQIRTRARRNIYLGKWVFRFAEEVSVLTKDGFAEETQIYFDRRLSPVLLFRIANDKIWTELEGNISISQGPSLYHTLSQLHALSYDVRFNSLHNGELSLTSIVFSTSYRRLLYQNWLYFTLSPAISFEKFNNYKKAHSIFFRLESVFGKI
jgi:hypothetical protein